MEIFGFITAILFGAVLAIVRERKSRKKLKSFQLSQDEISKINVRLSEVLQPKVETPNNQDMAADRLRKELDMMITLKFLSAYVRKLDSKVYEHSDYLTTAAYPSDISSSVSSQKKEADCYSWLQHSGAGTHSFAR